MRLERSSNDGELSNCREASSDGAPGRTRTNNLRFTKPLLCQLSYRGTCEQLPRRRLAIQQIFAHPSPGSRGHGETRRHGWILFGRVRSKNIFRFDSPAIHFEFEAYDRRAAEMPGEAPAGGTTSNQVIGKIGMHVEHRINLGIRRVLPAEAERAEPPFHLIQYAIRLLPHSCGAGVAIGHDVIAVVAAALGNFAAASDDEVGCQGFARPRIAEGMEDRRRRGAISGQTLLRATGLRPLAKSPQRSSVFT